MKKISKKLYLGLVGLPASGKTTTCDHLESIGFTRITLSSFIHKELEKQKKEASRRNLQDVGNHLRKKHGPGVLGKLAARCIKKKALDRAIIDGIRNLKEIEELKNRLTPFFVIGIKASSRNRFPRLKSNPKNKHIKTWQDFKFYEKRENKDFKGNYGLQVNACLKQSDYFIKNNQSLKAFYSKINQVIEKIKKDP